MAARKKLRKDKLHQDEDESDDDVIDIDEEQMKKFHVTLSRSIQNG